MFINDAAQRNDLEFLPEDHEYRVDGRKVPHVTQVINSILPKTSGSSWWKPQHSLRGKMVHSICEAEARGTWDPESTVIPEGYSRDAIIQRGMAYRKWAAGVGICLEESELMVYSDVLGIAGRIDQVVQFTRGPWIGERAIVDIKTGEPGPSSKIQVAMYSLLYEFQAHQHIDMHVILHLREDGTPRPQYITGEELRTNQGLALSVLAVYRFCEREGLISA